MTIIAYWKMFTKAGEKGWKAIIPVYSTYKIYDITWKGSMFWLSLAAGIVSVSYTHLDVYKRQMME